MKTLLTFAGLLAIAYTFSVPVPVPQIVTQPENVQGPIDIQKIVLNLLQNIDQPSYLSPEVERIGLSYDIEANIQNYKNPQYVEEFFKLYTTGVLPKGQIFSIFYPQHRREAIAFFRILYSAVDIETFYKTASWGRLFLNEGLYLYSVSVALVHRPDTANVELPPIYELYPYYFYNVDVFQQIQQQIGLNLIHSDEQRSYKLPYYFGQYMQQSPVLIQQGPIQYPKQRLFKRVPLQYQQSPLQYQQGPLQYQQIPLKYQQSPLQHQQGSLQYQQSPLQYQQGPLQYQQGPLQYQQSPQHQQIPLQYQQSPLQHQIPLQYQKPIQSQQVPPQLQGIYQGQKLPVQSQYGFVPRQQVPIQSQQVPFQQVPQQYQQGILGKQQGQQWQQGYQQWLQGLLQNQVPYQQQQQQIPEPLMYQQPWQQGIPYSQQYFQSYLQGQQQRVPYQQYGQVYGPQNIYQQNVPYSQQYLQSYLQGQQQRVPYQQYGQVYGPQNVYQQKPVQNGQIQQESIVEQMGQVPLSHYQTYLQQLQQRVEQQGQVPMVGETNKWINRLSVRSPVVKRMYPLSSVGAEEREKVPLWQNYQQDVITIESTYTQKTNPVHNREYVMNYFTEDIGLNAFYYYFNIYFPFWMTNEEINFNTERRGEQFYYIYQQLLARYTLERISNNLPEVPFISSKIPVESGFQSELIYPNGMPFPVRPNYSLINRGVHQGYEQIYDNYTMSYFNMNLYDKRLLNAIDSGFVLNRQGQLIPISEPEGIEILGNLIQVNAQSVNPRYYGSIMNIARSVWGYTKYPINEYNVVPSVMELYETTLRDPVFFQLVKRILYYFQRYQQYLPMYTQDQLLLNGVKIQDVKIDKLVTYFDNFYSDISIAVPSQVPIQIKQKRLNYIPFNYHLNVVSENPTQAVVRVFLGPKYGVNGEPIDINRERLNFVQLDKFQVNLVAGLNTIQRSSIEFNGVVPERTTTRELFMQLVGVQQTPVEIGQRIPLGIPQRLLLPRGTPEGQVYQMYFIITPQSISRSTIRSVMQQPTILPTDIIYDNLSFGYPFDRPIDESVFYVPNSLFQDVVIYNQENPSLPSGQIGLEMPMNQPNYESSPLFKPIVV